MFVWGLRDCFLIACDYLWFLVMITQVSRASVTGTMRHAGRMIVVSQATFTPKVHSGDEVFRPTVAFDCRESTMRFRFFGKDRPTFRSILALFFTE